MEFRDLKTQYSRYKAGIDSAIQNVLLSSHFIGGEPVKQLEEKLVDYVDVKHCITCANGTDALQLALMAWGIGEGDAVFVPDFTFFSTAEVVPWVNATPVFVDVDKDTFNISPHSLEMAIQEIIKEGKLTPKVVIVVDLFGRPADFPAIRAITEKYNLLLLEDGAQGFGGRIGNKKACSFGDIATTSFFPSKPLGCYGDGGAVFTDNDEWAKLIESYKVHGKGEDKYDNVRIGLNSRLDTLQAAVLLEKLQFFDEELLECDIVAAQYTELLKDIVQTPMIPVQVYSGWAQYTILLRNEEQRKKVMNELGIKGIPSAIYYKKPMHLQKAFENYNMKNLKYSVTEQICNSCLSLPMHAYLQPFNIEEVCRTLRSVVTQYEISV